MDNTQQIKNLTQRLIDFNTENFDDRPSGYTLELLEFVKKFLAQNKIKSKIYRYELEKNIDGQKVRLGKRGILISEFNPRKPIILFQGHADTVPIAQKFGRKYALVQKDIIKGRGAVDMKSSLAAFILALCEFKKHPELKYQPVLLITSDEEAGNFAGIKKFLEIYKKEKMPIKMAICGEATSFAIKSNLLGAMYLKFAFSGKSGHAANKKRGENAIEKAAFFLNELMKFQIELEKEKNVLGSSVLNIGTIKGGNKVNQIPVHCEIEISLRTIRKNNFYEKKLREIAKKSSGKMKVVFSYDPTFLSSSDSLIMKLIKSASKNKKKNQEIIMKEFTEATLLNNAGIKTVVLGPGNPLLNHSDNEHIRICDIEKYKQILEDFMLEMD